VTRALAAVLLLIATAATAAAETPQATADLHGTQGESIGPVTLSQGPQEVLISISFRNRTALVGTHAAGVYAVGRCDPPTFQSAGAMVSQLSDLVIGPAGVAVYNLSAPGAAVDSLVGRSLVVSQPDGSRVACAVIVGGAGTPVLSSVVIGLLGFSLIGAGILLRRRSKVR